MEINFDKESFLLFIFFVPLFWLGFCLMLQKTKKYKNFNKFADSSNAYSIVKFRQSFKNTYKIMISSSIILLLIIVALAGPRCWFREIKLEHPANNMVIVLDLSKSMTAEDTPNSRLERAIIEITDVIEKARGKIRIGLVVFANSPILISPVTEDLVSLQQMIQYLSHDYIKNHGSRVLPSIELATKMLQPYEGESNSILLISDGGFSDADKILTNISKNIKINILSVGTIFGAPIKTEQGDWLKYSKETLNNNLNSAKNGDAKDKVQDKLYISKLEVDNLRNIAKLSGGIYVESIPFGNQVKSIIYNLITLGENNKRSWDGRLIYWQEEYYWFLLAAMVIFLPVFRKNFVLLSLLFLIYFSNIENSSAADFNRFIYYFANQDHKALIEYNDGNYYKAAKMFSSKFNKAVAYYKASDYRLAETELDEYLKNNKDADAYYNLGNVKIKLKKYQEAIIAYKQALNYSNSHVEARHNLHIATLMADKYSKNSINNSQNVINHDITADEARINVADFVFSFKRGENNFSASENLLLELVNTNQSEMMKIRFIGENNSQSLSMVTQP